MRSSIKTDKEKNCRKSAAKQSHGNCEMRFWFVLQDGHKWPLWNEKRVPFNLNAIFLFKSLLMGSA